MASGTVSFDPRTALVVVDLQNDFADPRGSLYVRGASEVIERANAYVQLARQAGSTIAYTQDWHPAHTPHFAQDGGIWPVHCLAESWGARFVPNLIVDGAIIRKGAGGEDGYSGFSMRDVTTGETRLTELARLLSSAGVEVIVVCGVATDYCVKETSLDAVGLGSEVVVLTDAVSAVDLRPGDGERALEAMRGAGVRCI
ncbi:MAG: isochorismatase family protein [Actinomycetota bacterium]|jgi:nicotinamidase/pyrazinamidase|nr:isochorismatase family protein [Actinomycetota bacterium]